MNVQKKKVNFDYLYYIITNQCGLTVTDFCKQKLHRNGAYLSQIKIGKASWNDSLYEELKKHLDINEDALFMKQELAEEEPQEEPQEEEFSISDLESDFEKTVRKTLDDIATKLELVLELETKINRLTQDVNELMSRIPKENPADTAREILYLMMGNQTHIDYHDYSKRLADAGVPKEYARGAIKEYGAHIETTGYGKHKSVWILAPNTRTVERG